MTSNLEERFKSHNELGKKGWTQNYRPWIIFYQEVYEAKSAALQREKYLKSGKGREFIRGLLGVKSKGSYSPRRTEDRTLPSQQSLINLRFFNLVQK